MSGKKIEKRIYLSPKTNAILRENTAKTKLSEAEYITRLIEDRPLIAVPDDILDILSKLYEELNKFPNQDQKEIAETLLLIQKKYIYGNDKTLGSKQ